MVNWIFICAEIFIIALLLILWLLGKKILISQSRKYLTFSRLNDVNLSPQHLFMTFPRIVFMLGFVVFVFFLVVGYTLFHCYLALVNQTSNEWFKQKGHGCQYCNPVSGHRCRTFYNPLRGFYHRGILKNLGEIVWPLCPTQKKDN